MEAEWIFTKFELENSNLAFFCCGTPNILIRGMLDMRRLGVWGRGGLGLGAESLLIMRKGA